MQCLLYFTCLTSWLAFGASELSPTLAKYYCTYNGVYSYRQDQNVFQFRVQHVYIPALSQNPVTFVEQSVNGQVSVAEIGIVTEEPEQFVHVEPFNFTDYSSKKTGEININDYTNLTREQLKQNPGCGASVQLINNAYFVGSLPDCQHVTANGVHRDYSASLTCDAINVAVPAGAVSASATEGTLKREGANYDSFPLADPSYTCDCDQTSA